MLTLTLFSAVFFVYHTLFIFALPIPVASDGCTTNCHTDVNAQSALVRRYQPSSGWKTKVLDHHNTNRAQYGADKLEWSDELFLDTLNWARACDFRHSHDENFGENLAAGSEGFDFKTLFQGWMDEAPQYSYNDPENPKSAGHFTQVVWKGTSKVACAMADCPSGTVFPADPSKYLVCRYSQAGNFLGDFSRNVGQKV